MKSDKKKSWIVVGVISFLLTIMVLLKGNSLNINIYSDAMDVYGDKAVPYALFVLPDGNKEKINFWWCEEQHAYVLFTPGFWNEGDRLQIGQAEILSDAVSKKKGFAFFSKETIISNLFCGIYDAIIDGNQSQLIVMQSSTIPTMMVEMDSKEYKRRDGERLLDKQGANAADKSDEAINQVADETYKVWSDARVRVIDAEGNISTAALADEIRVRGNTSADWPKQPYQLTMKDSTDFLGMGSAKKWNLLSNWSDRTLLRNKITYDMAQSAGLDFTPESELVNLYINGEYQGCYQLCEKVEIGKNRVNITNLEDLTIYKPNADEKSGDNNNTPFLLDSYTDILEAAESGMKSDSAVDPIIIKTDQGTIINGYNTQLMTDNLTGGYLLELERPSRIKDSISFFITRNGQPVTIRSPKYADTKEAEYISGYWQGFEDALFSEDGVNPGNGLKFQDYIDVDSFVRKYLVEEIVRNYDASSTSQYFYKDIDDKLYAGPVWDYDMSLGNTIMNKTTNQQYVSSIDPYGIYAAYPFDESSLWAKLYEKHDFYAQVCDYYRDVYQPLIRELLDIKLDAYVSRIKTTGVADLMRWGRLDEKSADSWNSEYIEAVSVLRDFMEKREHYLTSIWIEGKQPRKIYLDGGEADMYVAWVEAFEGEKVPVPQGDPDLEGYRFVGWNNGYTGEPYDFDKIYAGEDLYLEAAYAEGE